MFIEVHSREISPMSDICPGRARAPDLPLQIVLVDGEDLVGGFNGPYLEQISALIKTAESSVGLTSWSSRIGDLTTYCTGFRLNNT